MTRIHTIYPDEFPEAWASNWDEDEYGLIMGFTYKGVRQDFRWIEPGVFPMGPPTSEPGRYEDEIQHEVTLTEGFWIADTVVTQALWEVFMGGNPGSFKGASRPVENVSWNDAQAFIDKLNGMKPELRLCLPSEAQWEYACRAGTTTPFHFGQQITLETVNYDSHFPYQNGKKGKYRGQTVEVKSLPCNAWGLYEMHGNVWEWCRDWYGSYPLKPVADPQGPPTGARRVLRGGSWMSGGGSCRSAYRHRAAPVNRYDDFGFRLARGHR